MYNNINNFLHQHKKIKREKIHRKKVFSKRKKTFSMPLDDINLAFGRCLSLINPHTRHSDDISRWLFFFLCFSCFLFAVFFVVQCSVYIFINSAKFSFLFPQRRSDCRGKNTRFSSVICQTLSSARSFVQFFFTYFHFTLAWFF